MKPHDTGHGAPLNYQINVDGKVLTFHEPKVTREQILEEAGKAPESCFALYQKLQGCDIELIRPREIVDLRQLGIEQFTIKDPVAFDYSFDGEPETTDNKTLLPAQILVQGGRNPTDYYLIQEVKNGPDVTYAFTPDAIITMNCKGMVFLSKPWAETVDIEEYGKSCKEVPPARHYRIRIQNAYYIIDTPFITGKDLLITSGHPDYQKYDVYVFGKDPKPRKIGYDEEIDLMTPCLKRFVVQPKEQTEGKVGRQSFTLPEGEDELLNQRGLHWETLLVGGIRWVLIHDYPIAEGYNVNKATVALRLDPGYPTAQIDMAYFFPALSRKDGKVIPAVTATVNIDGKIFQQWSRHRKNGEWQPGVDNIVTHLLCVDNWFTREFEKRP